MTREDKIKAITLKTWTWEYWAWFLIKENSVMIWDIMDYLEKNNLSEYIDWVTFDDIWNLQEFDNYILKDWKEKRKPIEEQSDDLINYVFDLIA